MYFNDEDKKTNIDSEFDEDKKFKFNFNFSPRLIIVVLVVLLVGGIGIYFISKPTLFKTEEFLVLNGSSNIVIYQNSVYEELGFNAYNSKNEILDESVIVEGFVNTDVVGEYIITYKLGDIVKTRVITVVSETEQTTYLVLKGSKTMYLKVGEIYTEPGYTVIDSVDANLGNKVKVTGSVDTKNVGTYKVNYSITNSSGVVISAYRTIIVMDSEIDLTYSPTDITNQKVTIKGTITDNYFDYILLPNGSKSNNRNFTYDVTNNGTYKFLVYSKDGSSKTGEIKVSNIDTEKPSGSCLGYYKDGKSYITVNAKDNVGISKYIINNKTYTNGSITINESLKSVSVVIYDIVGNSIDTSCTLQNKNTPAPSSNSSKPSSSKPSSSKPSGSSSKPSSSSSKSSSSSLKPSSNSNTYKPSSSQSGGTNLGKNNISVYLYSGTNQKMAYWLYKPSNARSNMPLIVFLHGAGEAGNDYQSKSTNAITWGIGRDIYRNGASFPAYVLVPQAPKEWNTTTINTMMSLTKKIVSENNINRSRVSIAGFSLGCIYMDSVLSMNPGYFSSVVAIECRRFSKTSKAPEIFAKVDTWMFASQDYMDDAMRPVYEKTKKLGGNIKYTYVKNYGHTGLVGNKNYSIFSDSKLGVVNWMITH